MSSSVIVTQAQPVLKKYTEAINVKLQKDESGIGKELSKLFGIYIEPVVGIPIEKEGENIVSLDDVILSNHPETEIPIANLTEKIQKENIKSSSPLTKKTRTSRNGMKESINKVISRVSNIYRTSMSRKRKLEGGGYKRRMTRKIRKRKPRRSQRKYPRRRFKK